MNIGFIGYGEAAFNISLGLGQEGLSGIRATDAMMDHPVMGVQVRDRAGQAGVALVSSAAEVAQWADVLFAAVPSSFTLDVCREVKDCLRPGQLYIDVSASTPATKEAIWDLIGGTGVLFVDAAMLGSLPKDKHRVPITASGNGASKFREVMAPHGMEITLAGEKAGAASAIKLVRSIFMKGIASLMIEMLQAADAYGVSDEVVSSISKSMDGIPFTSHLDRLVTGSALHCTRRAAELKGSIAMLSEAELSPEMTTAAKHRLEALEPYEFAKKYVEKKPGGWQEIIQAIRVNG
ncbi:MAG: NAD(P)-dependent oxidoreductase [Lawsonibacter sp.]|jgi:3-hydroxyisobutyrate dehydrogenase-like beta-hydroxyacid dehydrogenase|nr:NAD(P)-dependent oxidoreductase [Lawsonibacter sp.]MCI9567530.1 NAD(P)-dependent oxidoreductase [Lawsonibacter sp.]